MRYISAEGNTFQEALDKLKKEYGDEIIIYDQKKVATKSILGRIFKKEKCLISAAVLEKNIAKSSKKPILEDWSSLSKQIPNTNTQIENMELQKKKYPHTKELSTAESLENLRKFAQKMQNSSFSNTLSFENILQAKEKEEKKPKETLTLEKQVKELQNDITFIKESIDQRQTFSSNNLSTFDIKFEFIYNKLIKQDFSMTWSTDFIHHLQSIIPKSDWKVKNIILKTARELLQSYIPTQKIALNKRTIALVGPTGVGKTTTLAKIAQHIKFRKNKSVAFITIDNFRIAATQQLQVYSDIMNIPIYVCKTPKEFQERVETIEEDITLVDTSGFSQNNTDKLEQQSFFFKDMQKKVEFLLTLSATTKLEDTTYILDSFQIYPITKVILTKLDETQKYGSFVEVLNQYQLPFCYFSTGQNVPEDLANANPVYLTKKMLPS